jgi:hypothetical protein
VLKDLLDQHPLPSIILEHRKINKIVSSFLEPLVDLANKQPAGKADVIQMSCSSLLHPRPVYLTEPQSGATAGLSKTAA